MEAALAALCCVRYRSCTFARLTAVGREPEHGRIIQGSELFGGLREEFSDHQIVQPVIGISGTRHLR